VDIAFSKSRIPIRLTEERWIHIIESHDDLAGYYDDVLGSIEDPDYIIEGYGKAKIALRKLARNKYLAVVYKEVNQKDGFVITAYLTSKLKLEKELILWTRE
jgi:hypothetical protein